MRTVSIRRIASYVLLSLLIWQPVAFFKQGRLAAGIPVLLADLLRINPIWLTLLLIAFMASCEYAAASNRMRLAAATAYASALLPSLLMLSISGSALFSASDPIARYSLGPGFWSAVMGASIIATSCRVSWPQVLLLCLSSAFVFVGGYAPSLSLYKEFLNRKSTFAFEIGNHLKLSILSAAVSVVPGIFLGYAAHVNKHARTFILWLLNLIQVIPTLSLLGLIMLPLAALSSQFPLIRNLGIRGVGFTPAFIALSFYCIFPVTINTLAGFSSIDSKALFGAYAMGMTHNQVFLKVKLPLAFPVIFSGIRTAITQNVGNATIAGLVGGGGMGTIIFLGLSQAAYDLVLLGSLPVILLALLLDSSLVAAEKGLRKAVMHVND